MSHVDLDLLGEVCPVPLMRTQQAVSQMASGARLTLETDFARAVRNISQWCSREAHLYEVTEMKPSVWRIEIRKR